MDDYIAVFENRKLNDLNALYFGHNACKYGYSFGPAIREHFLIHYVKKGSGTLFADNKEYPVHAGQIFIIYPHEVTKYTASESDPWTYIWIGFDGALADNFKTLPRVVDETQGIFHDMLEVKKLSSMKEIFLTEKLFALYRSLFIEKTGSHHTRAVKHFIDTNYISDIHVKEIANSLGLDRRYLSRIFKKDYGITIQEYILKTRFRHAKELLNKGVSVKQTALSVGYKDPLLFSRMYKKHTGVSPTKDKEK